MKTRGFLPMNYFANIRRMVVKVGTSTLTHESGKLNLRRMDHLVRVLSDVRHRGIEVILVSSGAIGVGVGSLLVGTGMPFALEAGPIALGAGLLLVLGLIGATLATVRISSIDPHSALGENR